MSRYIQDVENQMRKALEHSTQALSRFQVGKANPELIEHISVNYHDTNMPITQLANITVLDVHTLQIQPWDKTVAAEIERALANSNLGLNPQNNGDTIILRIPPLSEERRRDVLKLCKQEVERGKVVLRNIRKDINDQIKRDPESNQDSLKHNNSQVQQVTDKYSKLLDDLLANKERSILDL